MVLVWCGTISNSADNINNKPRDQVLVPDLYRIQDHVRLSVFSNNPSSEIDHYINHKPNIQSQIENNPPNLRILLVHKKCDANRYDYHSSYE